MAPKLPINEILELREQGLTDALIVEELRKKGYNQVQINAGLSQLDTSNEEMPSPSTPSIPSTSTRQQQGGYSMPSTPNENYPGNYGGPAFGPAPQQSSTEDNNLYERIEETVEAMIDEKWDELIGEVKKIVEWKEKMEEQVRKIGSDLDKLKEDFKLLHQGVLGKIDDYDTRMRDVDTELKAVEKVFKDAVPEFVEGVKELREMTAKGRK